MAHTNFNHPEDSRRIVIHEWMIDFCQGNQAAAAVMSFLDYWHSINRVNQKRAAYLDELRRKRGLTDDDLNISWEWQFHTVQDFVDGTVIFSRTTIKTGLAKLHELNVVESRSNPFDHMDRTKWFKFNPAPAQQWLNDRKVKNDLSTGQKRPFDRSETTFRQVENNPSIYKETNNTNKQYKQTGGSHAHVREGSGETDAQTPPLVFPSLVVFADSNHHTSDQPGVQGGAGETIALQAKPSPAQANKGVTSAPVYANQGSLALAAQPDTRPQTQPAPVTAPALSLVPPQGTRPATQSQPASQPTEADRLTQIMAGRIDALGKLLPSDRSTRQFSDLLFAATELNLSGDDLSQFLAFAMERGKSRADLNIFKVKDLLPGFADWLHRGDGCQVSLSAFAGFDLDLVAAVLREAGRERATLTLKQDMPTLMGLLRFLRSQKANPAKLAGFRGWVERERQQTDCAISFEFIQRNWSRWTAYRQRQTAGVI